MFLYKLEGKEREVFLDLAVQTAKANGMVESKEKEMIKQYCREMAISEYTIFEEKTIDDIAEFFKETDTWKKKIVLIELIGLGVADDKFDKEERQFINNLAEKMGIETECINTLEENVKEYRKLVEKISGNVFS